MTDSRNPSFFVFVQELGYESTLLLLFSLYPTKAVLHLKIRRQLL